MNKIEKLDLKHICGYLPYGVRMFADNPPTGIPKDLELTIDTFYNQILKQKRKMLLLPLSALTEPLEDGTVPIVELAKIEGLIEPISFDVMEDLVGKQRGVCAKDKFNNQWLMFDFKEYFSLWHKPYKEPEHRPTLLSNQLQLFEYLYSKHFDIYGLIDAGLAIDKRTYTTI